ncbi:MAG: zinc ribbon domain-containing protein [Oscillospiraceae bacterium]|nr:zinc ribbon domain-containing protein [Oscillospiraceae bacterium]
MYCQYCGAKLPDNSRYCGVCGKDLSIEVIPSGSYAENKPVHEDIVKESVAEPETYESEKSGLYVVVFLSIFLLVFAIAVPMFSIWGGLFPEDYMWTASDTLESLSEDGLDALNYRPVALHVWTWIFGTALLFSALCKSRVFSAISAFLGIIVPGSVILAAIDSVGKSFVDSSYGYISISYYICLALFAISIIVIFVDWFRDS